MDFGTGITVVALKLGSIHPVLKNSITASQTSFPTTSQENPTKIVWTCCIGFVEIKNSIRDFIFGGEHGQNIVCVWIHKSENEVIHIVWIFICTYKTKEVSKIIDSKSNHNFRVFDDVITILKDWDCALGSFDLCNYMKEISVPWMISLK